MSKGPTSPEQVRKTILAELNRGATRVYDQVSPRLREFIEQNVPEAEFVQEGNKFRLKLKGK